MTDNHSRRRFLALASFAAVGVLGGVARAAEPASKPLMFSGKLDSTRVADDLVVLAGAGGNVAVWFDATRMLVIDAGMPHRSAELLAAVTKLAPAARSKTLFNTHWHFDHTGGNAAFIDAGFAIAGTAACRQRLGETVNLADMGMTVDPTPEHHRPTVTFEERLTLFAAAEPVRLIKFPASHTDTDAVAYFEKRNLLHTGDLLVSGGFPVIDRATGGSLDGMIAATKQLQTIGDAKTTIIPGHGPVGDQALIQTQLDLLNLVRDRLSPLAEMKLPMDEVLRRAPLADLDDKWGRGFLRSPVFTRMAYGQWVK